MRDDGDIDALIGLPTTCYLCGIACAQLCRAGKGEAGDALQNRALPGALVAYNNQL